jgi:hypothetical protein
MVMAVLWALGFGMRDSQEAQPFDKSPVRVFVFPANGLPAMGFPD